jgi:class 3 adenylate cyclase/tetratricopeptide (TPR) repeat protein
MERRLAAIFSADAQGYSRLMNEDEEATVQTLTTYREVMASLIHQHRGRVVDSPGDNLLAEFTSVVHAVQCAVAVQRELTALNTALPKSRKMEFRIGINLGEVLVDGERIYGDGVNIAARVEGMAEGGGICISGTAYDQVKNKLALEYQSLGEHTVKNIRDPVRMYWVHQPKPGTATAVVRWETRPSKRRWRWQALGRRRLLLGAACFLLLLLVGLALELRRRQASQDLSELFQAPYQALAKGEWSQAEASFQRLGSWAGKRVKSQVYAGLAAVAFARGDTQLALERAGRAEQLDPEVIYSHVIRGYILFAQGNIPEATQAYRTATTKTSGTPWQQAVAFNRLGRIYAARGFVGTALKYYDRAIDHHQNKAVVFANKAHLLEESGKRQEALILYRQALQMRPDDRFIMTLLREAEQRQQLAQDREVQSNLNQWVAERLQAYQEGQEPPIQVSVGWTSAPLTLAFLPFRHRGMFARRAGEEEFLVHHMAQTLQESGRLTIIDRVRLDPLLQELELSFFELTDPEIALRVGAIIGARLLAMGRIVRSGTQEEIRLRLIETATNKVRTLAKTSWTPGVFDDVPERLSRNLLQQVRQIYPLRGQIDHITPQNTLLLNIGTDVGVAPGISMLVFGPDGPVGRIEVTMVAPQSSQAKILQQTAPFQESWRVQEVQ